MEMEFETTPVTGEASVAKKATQNSEVMTQDLENSTSLGGSKSGSLNSDNAENDGEDGIEDDCDISDYDYDDNDGDYMFEEIDDEDHYLMNMQAQFDNADLPPGVEASVPWLNPSSNISIPSTDTFKLANDVFRNIEAIASSSSAGLSLSEKDKEEDGDEVMKKYEVFKHFDIVDEFSDHHYSDTGFNGQKPPSSWTKKIQDEWKILEKDLPDMIYVRAVEAKMELLRAVIIGPQGTPYHDGLFVFDIFFPTTYPDEPPMVYYYSGGLRLNPNLYNNGKVCLSLLNTWTGQTNEKWMPKKSTMLQVLVSIQALILNAKPFFNEPGYDRTYGGPEGEEKSNDYSDEVYILSLKTMMYTLRRPPQHFEDLVVGHFRARANVILSACRAYIKGAPVGSAINGKVPDGVAFTGRRSQEFPKVVGRLINGLISNFTKNGAKDCEQFRGSS